MSQEIDPAKENRNTAKFFVENRQIAWVLLIATVLWGVFGYQSMPQRKDPEVSTKVAVALTPWPGADAVKIEQLLTKKLEEQIASNSYVTKIDSISKTNVSIIYIELDDKLEETGKELDDIKLRLDSIHDLPEGAGPIQFIKDFGDTAALMLTVASPKASEVELSIRANSIRKAIEKVRQEASQADLNPGQSRFTLGYLYPDNIDPALIQSGLQAFVEYTKEKGFASDLRFVFTSGFAGLDAQSAADDSGIRAFLQSFMKERLNGSELHPDSWPVIIRNPSQTVQRVNAAAGDKYTYAQLDRFTDQIEKALKINSTVSKVVRSGILDQTIYLLYSQERLASYGVQPSALPDIISARNITRAGGQMEIDGKNMIIDPSGEFKSEDEIGDIMITSSPQDAPVYLRDLVDVVRSYDLPATYLNFYNSRDAEGNWIRSRAITFSIQMRSGEKIEEFAKQIDKTLEEVRTRLPEDLIIARTSDQPLQVEESIELFMSSLYEAVILVVLVSLIGFWEWRSAMLMALSIPITLAMTFGMVYVLGIDLQQVSIATLIIALGLLVDDPVVAGDAIKRELASGSPRSIAAWLGPTKLAVAILFATITNIVAYLPFLMLTGSTGEFLYSLPIVLTCSLVASRLVSMTFIPLLGYYLLKPKAERPLEERRTRGFAAQYYRIGSWAIQHRWKVLVSSFLFLGLGFGIGTQLKSQFFPKDLSYLSYVDIWLPEDASFTSTNQKAFEVEKIIRDLAAEQEDKDSLQSLTTFVGGGGPRFWYSLSPELQQLNYAQIIIQLKDKHETEPFILKLQNALNSKITGARVDARLLETGKPVGLPVQIRISGEEIATLRRLAEETGNIFRNIPKATSIRDDWGSESFRVKLQIDPDRSNMAGITNQDVAGASFIATSGYPVTYLREGDKQIPVVTRMRMDERGQFEDIQSLYVYSSQGPQNIPLRQISSISYEMKTEKLRRRNQFRTITVSAMPVEGALSSEVMSAAREQLQELESNLPPGYAMEIGGEEESQVEGFAELKIVLLISIAAIFLALVFQFRNAIKPFIVFAAVPYGAVGALASLWIMGQPFGFMAFLGVISLVGVIVSHIIVLFDFIEEKRLEGEPLQQALLDAGIMRLRPVMITVGATVIALFPLAAHGGPLWEPLCYAQIGGLCVATFVTLLLVPVIYSIFVLDLKWVQWEKIRG